MPAADELFTTAEAAVLAETPPAAVEKAIEEGIIDIRKGRVTKVNSRKRRLLPSRSIYYLAFLKNCDLRFSKKHKRQLWTWLKNTHSQQLLTAGYELSPGIHIRPGKLIGSVYKRVNWYSRARDRWIETNPEIKGGTPVIRGTRVSVYSVAGRIKHGETIDDVAQDNPDIPLEAIKAAATYADANPLIGRPRGRPWRE